MPRLDTLKAFALSLPGATVVRQWGDNLVFKVGGKLFLLLSLDGEILERMSFKCTPEEFKRLVEFDGIIPAPYLARASWVSLEDFAALPADELFASIRHSYELVVARLSKKLRAALNGKK